MNLNMLLKLGNLICAHADFAKFIKKTLDVCNQQKEKKFLWNLGIYLGILLEI